MTKPEKNLTQKEAISLIAWLHDMYPSLVYRETRARSWHDMLKDYPKSIIKHALKNLLKKGEKREDKQYAPSLPTVLDEINEIKKAEKRAKEHEKFAKKPPKKPLTIAEIAENRKLMKKAGFSSS